MTAYADLEIGLHRRDVERYGIELRFSQPESDADVRLVQRGPSLARFDLDQLRALALDDVAYGQLLTEGLFADSAVRTAFAQARSAVQALDASLRLRLFIGPSALELHDLRWETLRDPEDGGALLTGEHLLFSRYLSSLDWRPVSLRPKGDLRALVVIANPTNLADYQPGGRSLAPLDVDGELERAKSNLGDIPVTWLDSGGSATLEDISARLRDGYDVLYLVCHGALVKGEPHLWLEDEGGNVAVVAGNEWITRVQELRRRPRLVVLASCQSAGMGNDARSGDEGALAALGPRLAEAGIPVVIAMQGNVTMQTVAQFMPIFFKELQRDGQIDRAVAVARGAVRDRPDWWVPVLFMRLKSGRLWYTPGFADDRRGRGAKKWPALLGNIRQGRCTPIVGPGLTELLLGSRREIARRWAETYHYPMEPQYREDLPQVAQYLAVYQDYTFPRSELAQYLRQEIGQRYGGELGDGAREASLDELITRAGALRREQDPTEPHRVLAELPLSIYITTDPSNLLADALVAAGRDPQIEICRWNEYVETLPSIYDEEQDYRPTPERPLVYHLFGRLGEPDSVVLTEDDYFDYLIGATRDKDLIPAVVRRALADTALLFVGFRMEDWSFRVFFRSIMRQEGRSRRSRYAHVAVQIDPEEGRILDPDRARRYLESYFQDADISIYWGNVEDFGRELCDARKERIDDRPA
jgi:hypothetical protein